MITALLPYKKQIFSKLPFFVQLPLAKIYCNQKKERVQHLKTPVTMIFFVTSRCNLRCSHCFYWRELSTASHKELSIDEIKKIAHSFEHPISLSLTGGEPFLRRDLKEIVEVFHEGCGTREVGIATNGTLETSTVETVRSILDEGLLSNLSVQVSLDGLEKTHDAIRGIKGAFKKGLSTLKALEKIRKHYPNFYLKTVLSIQKLNISEIKEFVEYLLPLNIPLRFNIVRGGSFGVFHLPKNASSGFGPRDETGAFLSLDEIRQTYAYLRDWSDKNSFHFWPSRQQKIWELSIKMLEESRCEMPCYANAMESVLYANGDVAFCELSKTYANIREHDYDFRKIWKSEEANKMRKLISRCCCVHGCNLTTGLTFDPMTVISILKERERHRKSLSSAASPDF
jgi:MoaA/NifB/PqqE/SkfB family radical SAM enzyme